MNFAALHPYRPLLLVAAILGFVVFNLPYLYFAFLQPEVQSAALANGVALVFMGEALFLLLLFALLMGLLGLKRPGWLFFVAMSILGSMAFSVPLQLYLWAGKDQS